MPKRSPRIERALALRTRLALADPTDTRTQDDKAESELYLAQSLMALGRASEAQAAASRAIAALSELVKRDSDNARMRSSLANALALSVRFEAATGQRESALARIAEARRIRQEIATIIRISAFRPSAWPISMRSRPRYAQGAPLPVATTGMDPWRN